MQYRSFPSALTLGVAMASTDSEHRGISFSANPRTRTPGNEQEGMELNVRTTEGTFGNKTRRLKSGKRKSPENKVQLLLQTRTSKRFRTCGKAFAVRTGLLRSIRKTGP